MNPFKIQSTMRASLLALSLAALTATSVAQINIPSRNQRQEPWASQYLGYSSLRIRDYGCALTAISDYYNWRGVWLDPGQLNTLGKQRGWFSGSLVYWAPFFQYIGRTATRQYWENVPANMTLIRNEIWAGRPILLQTCIGGNSNNRHWVVGIGTNGGNDVYICDPLYGDRVWHSQRYGYAPRWIYGAVVVR